MPGMTALQTGGKIAGHCFRYMGRSCNPRKMAYLSYVVKRFLALVVCFLACSVLGFADLPRLSPSCCTGADSCHCNDPATVNPCTCSNHTDADFPKMAALASLPFSGVPPSSELQTEETAPLADLLPRWHPARPWYAPPEEKRARLSVWIL